MDKIVVKKGPSGKWYWNWVSRNGQIVATSQRYKSKRGAIKTANVVSKKKATVVVA